MWTYYGAGCKITPIFKLKLKTYMIFWSWGVLEVGPPPPVEATLYFCHFQVLFREVPRSVWCEGLSPEQAGVRGAPASAGLSSVCAVVLQWEPETRGAGRCADLPWGPLSLGLWGAQDSRVFSEALRGSSGVLPPVSVYPETPRASRRLRQQG